MSAQTYPSDERVIIEEPERMNLLGLLMGSLLSDNMANDAKYTFAEKIEGDLQVQAGRMIVTLRFDRGRLFVKKGPSAKAQAWVRGTMSGMLNLVTATDLIRPFALRQVRFGGNIFLLLRVLPLVVAPNVLNERLNELRDKITSLSPL